MRYFCCVIIAAVLLSVAFAADEKQEDFSGTWIFDPDHSEIERSKSRGMPKVKISIGVIVRGPDEDMDISLPEPPLEDRMKGLNLQIKQSDGILQIIRTFVLDGEKKKFIQTFALDGSRNINRGSDGKGEFVSRSSWKKRKLVHSGIKAVEAPYGKDEIYVQEEYALSKKGKRLTIKIRHITSKGVVKIKQVFTRLEPGSKAATGQSQYRKIISIGSPSDHPQCRV
jgi:hypothetical protein